MKAALYTGNRTLVVRDSVAQKPGPGEVRVDVAYCGICGTDLHIFHGHMDKRVQMPQIIGHEVSGTVAEVGEAVTRLKVGDRVAVRPLRFGEPAAYDRGFRHVGKNLKFLGIDSAGGMQAYWTVPEYTLHLLPKELSLLQGAMIEPAAVACHDVRLGEVKPGETCVVIGGGPIGLLIALVAKNRGAKVILSEISESRLALAATLGVVGVDPRKVALATAVAEITGGAMADCAFEVSGSAAGVEVMTEVLNVRGRIVMVAIHPQAKPVNLFKFFWAELKMIGARLYEEQDFDEAIALAASGRLHLDKLITGVSPIDEVQQVFNSIDANPSGIKHLIQCR